MPRHRRGARRGIGDTPHRERHDEHGEVNAAGRFGRHVCQLGAAESLGRNTVTPPADAGTTATMGPMVIGAGETAFVELLLQQHSNHEV
ncbi:MAG: hypothetical protein ABJZ69_01825 [Hyphomicrobiales bacterium]